MGNNLCDSRSGNKFYIVYYRSKGPMAYLSDGSFFVEK